MSVLNRFYGPNAGYVLELYERYLNDPDSIDLETRSYFEQWGPEVLSGTTNGRAPAATTVAVDVQKIVAAVNLARAIRRHGHRAAQLDPLGSSPPGEPSLDPAAHGITEADLAALPASVVGGPVVAGSSNAAEAITKLRAIYTGPLGYDVDHVEDATERAWLQEAIESGRYRRELSDNDKRQLLRRLTDVEAFEQYLHKAFVGQKRFSIEGTDMMVPMLDQMIASAAQSGFDEVMIGMAHRGRLNVMAHVMGKPYEDFLAKFLGKYGRTATAASEDGTEGWTGDVKYHLGAKRPSGEIKTHVTLASNPSHLEFVNPVVEGMARAAQDRRDQAGPAAQNVNACLPILQHGDAAFPGEGIVPETLNISQLAGYHTGGTLHIIGNNQVGFTTNPDQGRSTFYASDIARGFEIPVIHVNADDPEACLAATWMAFDYRQEFHKDFLIDLVGYRRWGHNEGDEPGFTQPLLYAQISSHPTVRARWAEKLDRDGVMPLAESEEIYRQALAHLQELRTQVAEGGMRGDGAHGGHSNGKLRRADTAITMDQLRALNQQIHALPEGFNMNPKLRRNMERRKNSVEEGQAIDWAHAETLAFASLLAEGTPIRMSGQDSERGTFSQRHLVFHDVENGQTATPLQLMPQARASFEVYNSPLSETAVMGFEYGYSVHAPETLVLWEGQFGDFANAAQVIIDQFISAARAKWEDLPSLVLLLPHGYEGQGPEHSSGRVERYLQLAADDNIRVANCTTSAQYFHLLRKQAKLLKSAPRPLIIMTPKSLLRNPKAASLPEEFVNGEFQPVLDDSEAASRREAVGRVILCSGKVYVDLVSSSQRESSENVAIVRVEQLYPFPDELLRQLIASYPNAREIIWLQEEPRNMGGWRFVEPLLREISGDALDVRYIGRPERASPAEGLAETHAEEQARIVAEAFEGAPVPELKTYGVKHAD